MRADIVIPTTWNESQVEELIARIKRTACDYREIIVASGKQSAAKNRNAGLGKTKAPFVIMCDDDIIDFPYGWDKLLIDALEGSGASMVSARLVNMDGTLQRTCAEVYDLSKELVETKVLPTTCCVFRNTDKRFDENYIGSGWEDTDWCRQLGGKFYILNVVRVVHANEKRNQLGEYWNRNKKYFEGKWK